MWKRDKVNEFEQKHIEINNVKIVSAITEENELKEAKNYWKIEEKKRKIRFLTEKSIELKKKLKSAKKTKIKRRERKRIIETS